MRYNPYQPSWMQGENTQRSLFSWSSLLAQRNSLCKCECNCQHLLALQSDNFVA